MSPGFSLRKLLGNLPDKALRELSRGATELVEHRSNGALSHDSIVELVLASRTAQDLLGDPEGRELLLPALPAVNLNELLNRLGLSEYSLDSALLALRALPVRDLAELFRYFGYRPPHLAARSARDSEESVAKADYGLFEHQRRMVSQATAALRAPARRALVHMPTGSGKTRTAMHIVADHLRHDTGNVLWLAQTKELLDQAADEFLHAWRRLGDRRVALFRYWGDAGEEVLGARASFIVAGLGKLHALSGRQIEGFLTLADHTTLTVVDEAHQSTAPTFKLIIQSFSTKRADAALLGLTATPGRTWADRDEDRLLAELFGVNKITLTVPGYESAVQYLIDEGYLAQPEFRQATVRCGLHWNHDDSDADFSLPTLDTLANSLEWNVELLDQLMELMTRHSRVIVFTANVAQAYRLAAATRALGHRAEAVSATTPSNERDRIIRQFRANAPGPMALFNYGVLTAGFDAPQTSAVLVARPTRSLVLYSQMVGRATRGPRAGGNERCEIVTVIDPDLPGFGSVVEAFSNWEDVWK